ncbi:hypothetical protein VTP01DRAFT_7253 [Rhizomucor pusillus]|uniref:uncharacterized protein n=1 Tax=Rhizomucor pusillus TaxID=4840 RepID=UPI0037434E5C
MSQVRRSSRTTYMMILSDLSLCHRQATTQIGKLIYMANKHYPFLVDYYSGVYKEQFVARANDTSSATTVTNRIQKMPTVEILGQTFISDASRHSRASPFVSVVCLHHQERFLRPARVLYYLTYDVCRQGVFVKHTLAFVQYYQPRQHHWSSYEAIDISGYNMQPAPLSKGCIAPVHCLYSTVSVFPLKIDNCAAFVFLPRKIKAAC